MNPLFDPTIAYVLVMMSVFMVIVTILLPGTGLPETVTVLLILASWFVISHLAINTLALAILLLALAPLYLAYRSTANRKVLLLVSTALLIGGSMFLFVDGQGKPLVDVWMSVIASVLFVLFNWVFMTRGMKILNTRSSMDPDTPVGKIGEARSAIDPKGSVYVNGELWSARGTSPISEGETVRVLRRDGFTLTVTKQDQDS